MLNGLIYSNALLVNDFQLIYAQIFSTHSLSLFADYSIARPH